MMKGQPKPQLPLESRLQIMEIKKDFRSGNFFASKGTQLKGEVIVVPSITPPSPRFFKVYEAVSGKVSGDILIPYEYFEEKEKAPYHFQNPFKTDGSDFGVGKFYFVIGIGVLFLIYKLIKK